MNRLILHDLLRWKTRKDRKPLILKGVRQCGKTYILREFGRENYEQVAYFNFEENPALAERFEANLNPGRIITELGVLAGKKIDPESTLIIFDEIQFCHQALTSLKYFHESAPEYHIACAGSLLGIALSGPNAFPVGKVDFLSLRPLSFYEFVMAHGEQMLLDHIKDLSADGNVPQIFEDKLIMLLKQYYLTGGMPEVVANWIDNQDVAEVERIQDLILNAYELDFSKHAPLADFPKLSLIWKSIPGQLARENAKFMYGHVRKGARAKDLENALQWLIGAGMVYQVKKIDKPAMPLEAYAHPGFFKLYLSDIGLLRRLARLPAASIIEDSRLYQEFKGALVENYVLCELIHLLETVPHYWKSGNTAEVDFIVQMGEAIVPVEVKAAMNVRSRSIGVYRESYNPDILVRTSMLNLKRDGRLVNVPLYMLWAMKSLLSGHTMPAKTPDRSASSPGPPFYRK